MGRLVSMAQEGRKTGGLLGQALQGAMTGSLMEALTPVSILVSLPVCTVTPALLHLCVRVCLVICKVCFACHPMLTLQWVICLLGVSKRLAWVAFIDCGFMQRPHS